MKEKPPLRPKKNLWKFLINHQQWLGFIALVVAILYAYVTLLFEPRHPLLDGVYAMFFLFLLIGLLQAFRMEKEQIKIISFRDLDGLFAVVGVYATYSIVHFFGVSAVLASSLIGILGYFFVKKHQVAIYCGSFAGMVSVALFNYYEVTVLAIICAFIFILTKSLFSGYGGKLGTVAFMSSLITFSIFQEEYMVIESDFNIWLLLLTSILGAVLTYSIQHYIKTSAVLASASVSFLFAIMMIYLVKNHMEYTVIFFCASFIGMSSKERLPNLLYVLVSGFILGLIYFIFTEYFHGLGGKLGLMAMMSVIITSGVVAIFRKKNLKLQKTPNH